MIRQVFQFGRMRGQCTRMPAIRLFSGSAPRTEESNTSSLSAAEQELDLILAKEGHKKLYYASQANTIRAMLAVAGVNFMYWGTQAAQYFVYEGVVAQGIDLSVHPMWAAFGVTLTGLVSFFTRSYAHSAVLQAYETADGRRIGVQTHTILGFPGQKVEFPIGNAHLLQPKENYLDPSLSKDESGSIKSMFFSNTQIPVKLAGFKSNLVFDKKGSYYEDYRLLDLLSASAASEAVKVDKAERVNWKNSKNSRYPSKK